MSGGFLPYSPAELEELERQERNDAYPCQHEWEWVSDSYYYEGKKHDLSHWSCVRCGAQKIWNKG